MSEAELLGITNKKTWHYRGIYIDTVENTPSYILANMESRSGRKKPYFSFEIHMLKERAKKTEGIEHVGRGEVSLHRAEGIITIAADYNHLWNEEMDYYGDHDKALHDAKETVDELISDGWIEGGNHDRH
jgi:hypothetical protein